MKVFAVYSGEVFGTLMDHREYRKIDSLYSNKDAAYKRARELADKNRQLFSFVRKAVDKLESDGYIDVVFIADPDKPVAMPFTIDNIEYRYTVEEMEVIE